MACMHLHNAQLHPQWRYLELLQHSPDDLRLYVAASLDFERSDRSYWSHLRTRRGMDVRQVA
jgi:hypothetical protein